jgi:hypothetical protein
MFNILKFKDNMKNSLIEMVSHHHNMIVEYQNKVTENLNKLGYETTTPVLPTTLFVDMVKKTEFTDEQIMLIQQLLVNAYTAGTIDGYTDEDINNEVETHINFHV